MVARTVAVLDVVAFFDVEVGDAAEGGGADVDVGLGLDLAGAADDGDEILADDLAGGDLGDVGLVVQHRADGDAAEHKEDDDDEDDLFSRSLQLSRQPGCGRVGVLSGNQSWQFRCKVRSRGQRWFRGRWRRAAAIRVRKRVGASIRATRR